MREDDGRQPLPEDVCDAMLMLHDAAVLTIAERDGEFPDHFSSDEFIAIYIEAAHQFLGVLERSNEPWLSAEAIMGRYFTVVGIA